MRPSRTRLHGLRASRGGAAGRRPPGAAVPGPGRPTGRAVPRLGLDRSGHRHRHFLRDPRTGDERGNAPPGEPGGDRRPPGLRPARGSGPPGRPAAGQLWRAFLRRSPVRPRREVAGAGGDRGSTRRRRTFDRGRSHAGRHTRPGVDRALRRAVSHRRLPLVQGGDAAPGVKGQPPSTRPTPRSKIWPR